MSRDERYNTILKITGVVLVIGGLLTDRLDIMVVGVLAALLVLSNMLFVEARLLSEANAELRRDLQTAVNTINAIAKATIH